MQQVQLYISGQQVELFKDETISLTQSIQNVKDIAKVFTDFTKSFSVPASKANNKLFKHYYNFDIVGGFDARVKTSGLIKLNGLDFKTGKIKLEGVDLKDNKPQAYRITFFGNLVNLKDLIGEDKLDSLSFLDYFTLEYASSEVRTRLSYGWDITIDGESINDIIIAPLISCSSRLYFDSSSQTLDDGNLQYDSSYRHGVRWDDLKYGIKAYAIIRAIEYKYGIEFTKGGTDDFIKDINNTDTIWGALYLWLHRKSGKYATSVDESSGNYSRFINNIDVDSDICSYTHNGHTWKIASENDKIIASGLKGTIYGGPNGGSMFLQAQVNIEPVTADLNKDYTLKRYRNGQLIQEVKLTGNDSIYVFFGNGENTFEIVADEAMTFQKFELDCKILEMTGWPPVSNPLATGSVDITSNFSLAGFQFYPTQQIPEMKVLDFLTGLFKTFNLTAYVQDDGKIKIQTLDDFFDSSEDYDITEYVDVNSSKVDAGLPFSKLNFKFKESKSVLAAKFDQLNNKQFGQLEYNAESSDNFAGKEYKIEVPWEKMLFERLTDQSQQSSRVADDDVKIQYGLMLNENLQNYLGKPLLFFADQKITTTDGAISFVAEDGNHYFTNVYYAPTHSLKLGDTTTQTLLFNEEIDPYTKSQLPESLFENYYKNYVVDIFNDRRRLTKIKAFLPLKILNNFTLADTFIVSGKKYKINSITTNLQTGESKLELLNEV